METDHIHADNYLTETKDWSVTSFSRNGYYA